MFNLRDFARVVQVSGLLIIDWSTKYLALKSIVLLVNETEVARVEDTKVVRQFCSWKLNFWEVNSLVCKTPKA